MKLGSQLRDALREAKRALELGKSRNNNTPPVRNGGFVSPPAPPGDSSENGLGIGPRREVGLAPWEDHLPHRDATLTAALARTAISRTGLTANKVSGSEKALPAAASSTNNRSPESTRTETEGSITGLSTFRPNPLLSLDRSSELPLPILSTDGSILQLTDSPSNETDLVVGLDFGTACTKVVIRDNLREEAFPVPLRGNLNGVEAFLIPSRVYCDNGCYALQGQRGIVGDLKLRLISSPAPSPVDEFNDCCAFLALVIRRARAWFFTEHRATYNRHSLNWFVNLGLPTRSYEDMGRLDLFRRLAWAAAKVAEQPPAQITRDLVDRFRVLSKEAVSGQSDARPPDRSNLEGTGVIPEVTAQIHALMTSRWDWRNRSTMMLVDVGGGTVDAAIFHVGMLSGDERRMSFYSSRVEQNGVVNLHRARVDRLSSMLPAHPDARPVLEYLERSVTRTDGQMPIPETVAEYLPGCSIPAAGISVDEDFWHSRIVRQMGSCITEAKKKLRQGGRTVTQLDGIPLLLCGGGARMDYYRRLTEFLNETQKCRTVRLEEMDMPLPRDAADHGLSASEFDRLSVAYGLSRVSGPDAIDKIVCPDEIADLEVEPTGVRFSKRYVSKDDV